MPAKTPARETRDGLFVRFRDHDSPKGVSLGTLNQWVQYLDTDKTKYIHEALVEKMERDRQALAHRLAKPVVAIKRGQPVLADGGLTRKEVQLMRAAVKEKHGDPKIKWKPNPLLSHLLADV